MVIFVLKKSRINKVFENFKSFPVVYFPIFLSPCVTPIFFIKKIWLEFRWVQNHFSYLRIDSDRAKSFIKDFWGWPMEPKRFIRKSMYEMGLEVVRTKRSTLVYTHQRANGKKYENNFSTKIYCLVFFAGCFRYSSAYSALDIYLNFNFSMLYRLCLCICVCGAHVSTWRWCRLLLLRSLFSYFSSSLFPIFLEIVAARQWRRQRWRRMWCTRCVFGERVRFAVKAWSESNFTRSFTRSSGRHLMKRKKSQALGNQQRRRRRRQ